LSARRSGVRPILFSLPALLFVGVLFLLPVASLGVTSFFDVSDDGRWSFTLSHYTELLTEGYDLGLMWRTLKLSLITTMLSLVFAFPLALYMRQISPRMRSILTLALLSPLLTSVVVRTLAWVILLGPKGVVNGALAAMGLPHVALIYNEFGVVIGLTHVFFGYMALSLMTSVLKIDENLLLAAGNLGASRWVILREIVLPLSMPGILAGSVLVFTMSASTYATPVLLGGSSTKMIAPEVYDLAINYLDWSSAAALCVVLFIGISSIVTAATAFAESGRRRMVFE
jgi:putative spermidine/putrescine transport system permease protein